MSPRLLLRAAQAASYRMYAEAMTLAITLLPASLRHLRARVDDDAMVGELAILARVSLDMLDADVARVRRAEARYRRLMTAYSRAADLEPKGDE